MENTYIYVCSPYGGKKENYERAVVYGRFVTAKGHIPLIPHTMLHGIVDDNDPEQRAAALKAGRDMLKLCSEVWVFGGSEGASEGMRGEIETAARFGIPVRYIDGSTPLDPDGISADISRCLKHFEATFCKINRAISEDIIHFIKKEGIDAELICLCIDLAAKKPAYWNYAAAILNRCVAENIKTVEQFRAASRGGQANKKYSFGAYDLELFEEMLDKT